MERVQGTESTEKFAADKQWVLNFRVRDLDAMLEQLTAAGVPVEEERPHEQGSRDHADPPFAPSGTR
jgi:hypothetical protein